MKLSVIIPVFRGGDIIKGLFEKTNSTLIEKFEYEVLFVCDGCDYRSQSVLEELNEHYSDHIKIFYFARNYGQHRAIQFGFGKATGDFVITMDEDLQHNPEDILKLVSKQQEGGYDIVYGKFNMLRHKGIRNKMSVLLRKTLKYFIPGLCDNYSPYRLIKREIAIKASTMVSSYTFIDDYLSKFTRNIAYTHINHHNRPEGESSYTFLKLCKHGVRILFSYSKLIYWLFTTSLVLVIVGLLWFFICAFMKQSAISGNEIDLVSMVLLGIGLIFFISGLTGVYINHRNLKINTRSVVLLGEGQS